MKNKIFLTMALVVLSFASKGFCEEGWKEYRGVHFLIYYKDAPEDFIKTVEQSAENYYQEITDNLGFSRSNIWSWDERAKIYIYKDYQDYVDSARTAKWSHGVASARKKMIRTFPTMHGFFDSTLPHELGHIIFREFIGFHARVPLWLEEGVAMYQEKAKRWGVNNLVKKAIEDGTFIPLDRLSKVELSSNSPKELVELFYAESASIVYYLISEFGKYKFVSFCRKLKERKSFENALYSAYYRFKDVHDLNEAWVKYLKD